MESKLQQVLRSLCSETGWKYAVFWKLTHQSRMILTWEDAYYDRNQYPETKCFNETAGSLKDCNYSRDPLGLAVAKMSYQVYSLGEGFVGQVAVSGKHAWLFSDMHIPESSPISEYFGGWQNQFSAGIKTIVVVAVIPHGVVQLGSLHKIAEDVKLVDHIRNVFSELQDFLAGIPSSLQSNAENSTTVTTTKPVIPINWGRQSNAENLCLSDMGTANADSADCIAKLDTRSSHKDELNLWSQFFPSLRKPSNHSHIFSPPGGLSNKTIDSKMHEGAECSLSRHETSLPSSSIYIPTRHEQKKVTESLSGAKCTVEMDDLRDSGKRPQSMTMPAVQNVRSDTSNLYNGTLPTDGSPFVTSDLPLGFLDSPAFHDQGLFHVPELSSLQLHQDFEKNLELQNRSNHVETEASPFSFSAGYELYEALGASFTKQNNCVWMPERTCSDMAIEMSEGMGSSSLMMDTSDMHLLDAVVAKVNHKGDDTTSTKLCGDSESLLTAEKTSCMSLGSISSAGYSFDRETSSSFNSVTCGVESIKGFSSPSSSRGSEHLGKSCEPVKNKKRARPGESCRPRPRDRQLIQDRIKELRELVPNGSKCSIDSLLERTVKHMLYLQSITKHAEKLQNCSASKLLDKATGMRRFSCREQGSSWAVEVGNNSKVCPIIVENINMNGQMLVEMLSEECNQFLDMAETIRSLGLTILKGVSEAYGDKMWMCFVVEGQNNRSMHRMDVLWSLMQLLQPKTAN